jgi:hypothetical protein
LVQSEEFIRGAFLEHTYIHDTGDASNLFAYTELEFLKSLWGLGTEEE